MTINEEDIFCGLQRIIAITQALHSANELEEECAQTLLYILEDEAKKQARVLEKEIWPDYVPPGQKTEAH